LASGYSETDSQSDHAKPETPPDHSEQHDRPANGEP